MSAMKWAGRFNFTLKSIRLHIWWRRDGRASTVNTTEKESPNIGFATVFLSSTDSRKVTQHGIPWKFYGNPGHLFLS